MWDSVGSPLALWRHGGCSGHSALILYFSCPPPPCRQQRIQHRPAFLTPLSPLLRTGGNKYSGGMAAAADILRNDGPKGFFKGWVANFARLGPQTVITFIVCERLRDVLGMKSF